MRKNDSLICALGQLSGRAWWDAMAAIRKELRADFFPWIEKKLHSWKLRAKVIEELAWNDHNSDWALYRSEILETHRFPREDQIVTARDVADSLDALL